MNPTTTTITTISNYNNPPRNSYPLPPSLLLTTPPLTIVCFLFWNHLAAASWLLGPEPPRPPKDYTH